VTDGAQDGLGLVDMGAKSRKPPWVPPSRPWVMGDAEGHVLLEVALGRAEHTFETQDYSTRLSSDMKENYPTIDLGLGEGMPEMVRGTITAEGWNFDVEVTIRNTLAGPEVIAVSTKAAEGHSISTADLRLIAIDKIVFTVQAAALNRTSPGLDPIRLEPATSLTKTDRLKRAANVYRLAMVMRMNATETVARSLDVSRATAGRLVRQARDAGLLGPAIGTKSGERRTN
jgi:hypothetical protein